MTKHKSSFRKQGLILAHDLRRDTVHPGRKQGSCLGRTESRTLVHRMVSPRFKVGLSSSVKPF